MTVLESGILGISGLGAGLLGGGAGGVPSSDHYVTARAHSLNVKAQPTMTTPETTDPPFVYLATVEQAVSPGVSVDMTDLLVSPQAPTSPAATLTDPQGKSVTLPNPPAVSGNLVNVPIPLGVITKPGSYQLTVTMTPSGTSNIFATVTQIIAPF